MRVNEIFYSIQGEGSFQGLPTVFIRLQGCNLMPRCSFCDTGYAQDPSRGEELSVKDVVDKVVDLNPHLSSWVCITGGEPLFQEPELRGLVEALHEANRVLVTIETNGSHRPPRWYTKVSSWNADIKCPSSGVCGTSKMDWFRTRPMDQIRFVVGTKEDLDFARRLILENRSCSPRIEISPVFPKTLDGEGDEWLQKVAEFSKEMRIRYSLQIHKVIWGRKKGV